MMGLEEEITANSEENDGEDRQGGETTTATLLLFITLMPGSVHAASVSGPFFSW